ncbi:MAG TPA: MmgE/PrpD family protein [Casimicrobiaceae bacterium]|nr:MmgE/PrpD family protein [Casimicrobiaceae bacterium]
MDQATANQARALTEMNPDTPPVTRQLADFVASHPPGGWDERVEREAQRTLLNWLGCAIGASRHAAVEAALAAVNEFSPAAQATILGRSERVDMAGAALINGISSHTFDFDDTHLRTIIHPAGPVASAALALAEHSGSSGRRLLDAIVIGADVACRVGNAVYPDHYDRGWHITGSTGMLGAAAACSRILGLDAQGTLMALGIAASQPIGVREQFGSMTKAFHVGGAARAGLTSALLAKHGYTASARALEAPRGLLRTFSAKCDWDEINQELGKRFEIAFNTYKPFACGVVIHPSIDGCVQLRKAHGLSAEDIERIALKVHPLVLELTGKRAPKSGLEGKFSVYHACAAGIIFGAAGESQFSDSIVARGDVIALRDRIEASVDPSISEASADVTIVCRNGRTLHVLVEHAIGSLERPMTNEDLRQKFHALVDPVLGPGRATSLIERCAELAAAADVRALIATARP